MKKIIETPNAPKAVGPYSQAIEINGTLYISGQIPLNPKTMTVVDGGIKEQTIQVLKNIGAILEAAAYSYNDVVKSTCLLADISLFKEMNEIYEQFYSENKPSRSTFAVKDLPLRVLVEIETIAAK